MSPTHRLVSNKMPCQIPLMKQHLEALIERLLPEAILCRPFFAILSNSKTIMASLPGLQKMPDKACVQKSILIYKPQYFDVSGIHRQIRESAFCRDIS